MDRVLLLERVMGDRYVSRTFIPELPPTLTLYAPMVVPHIDRVLLVESAVRVEYALSAYNFQSPNILTLFTSMVEP